MANSQVLCKASRPNELSFITCSSEALLEREKLARVLVSYNWGEHSGESALPGNTNLTVICRDLARVFGRPVLAVLDLLSLCLHSGPIGPPQQWQVRWAQDLHRVLTLLPWFQHVRTRNSLLGAWAQFAFKRFRKWGNRGLEVPSGDLSIFQGNLSTVLFKPFG